MSLLGALPVIGGALDAISGVTSARNARNAFKTRYQDTVRDMRKAGLNPALAYGQGGGNPQTSDLPDVGSSITRGVQTAASAKQASQQAAYIQAQTGLLKAQTADLVSQAGLRTKMMDVGLGIAGQNLKSGQLQLKSSEEAWNDEVKARIARARATLEEPASAKASRRLLELSIPEAEAGSQFFRGIGKYDPYLRSALDVIRSIPGFSWSSGSSAGSFNRGTGWHSGSNSSFRFR